MNVFSTKYFLKRASDFMTQTKDSLKEIKDSILRQGELLESLRDPTTNQSSHGIRRFPRTDSRSTQLWGIGNSPSCFRNCKDQTINWESVPTDELSLLLRDYVLTIPSKRRLLKILQGRHSNWTCPDPNWFTNHADDVYDLVPVPIDNVTALVELNMLSNIVVALSPTMDKLGIPSETPVAEALHEMYKKVCELTDSVMINDDELKEGECGKDGLDRLAVNDVPVFDGVLDFTTWTKEDLTDVLNSHSFVYNDEQLNKLCEAVRFRIRDYDKWPDAQDFEMIVRESAEELDLIADEAHSQSHK